MSPCPRPSAGLRLVRLAWKRCLPLAFWLPFSAFLLLTLVVWNQDSELLIEPAAWLQRAQLRQSAWVLLVCLGAPVLIARSAGLGQAWRSSDADWFGALPVGSWCWVLSCMLGLMGAAAGLVLATAGMTELAIREDAPSGRFVRTLQHAGANLLDGDLAVEWVQPDLRLEQLPIGSSLVFRPSIAHGSGPSVELAFHILQDMEGIGDRPPTRALIYGPSRVRVALPVGASGPARLALQRLSNGAPAVLPRAHVDLISGIDSERWISVDLALWALVFLSSWSALAAGLGAWMRPALAAWLCLASIGLSWWGDASLAYLPGAEAPEAWVRVGQGWAPGALAGSVWTSSGSMLLIGVLLLQRGIQRGKQLG